MTRIEMGDKISINSEYIFRIHKGNVLLDNGWSHHHIIDSGTDIWEMLVQGMSLNKIVANLALKYELNESDVILDVLDFINTLYTRGLVKKNGDLYKGRQKGSNLVEQASDTEALDTDFFQKIVVETTYNCNLGCKYCYADSGEHEQLNLDMIIEALNESRDLGAFYLTLTGGEPFVRKDILEIIKYARSKSFLVSIQTNGTLIEPHIAEELGRCKPLTVAITLHGSNANIHDQFTGVSGSFEKALRGIILLKGQDIPLTIKFVITKKNYEEIDNMIDLATNLGVRINMSPLIYPTAEGQTHPFALRITDEQVAQLIDRGKYLPQQDPCGAGEAKAVISPEGNIYPCPFVHIPMGNLYENAFTSILQGTVAKQIIEKGLFKLTEECRKCEVLEYCPRCPAISYRETGNYRSKTSFSCNAAYAFHDYLKCGGGLSVG